MSKRVLKYARENFNEVMHTTLNPDGPGVVRIHLIPPAIEGDEVGSGVVILNGQDIINVNTSWTILLSEYIKEVNKFDGKQVTDDDLDVVMKATVKNMKKVYPFISAKRIAEDIYVIAKSLVNISRGQRPLTDVPYMDIGKYAPYMRAPHRMDLMISSMSKDGCWNCNQKCVHCYAAGQVQAEEAELSTDEWKTIIDNCRKACIPQLTFTGGEPSMREDLVELINYSRWFVTRLNTNGVALTKELCAKLKEASLDSMQITFYSYDEEIHNKLVGAERFDDAVRGIENALEAGINLSINTPLCTLNKEYKKTLEFLHEKGVMYVTCSGLITTGNALKEESESLQLSREEIKEILREAVGYCYENDMEISFTSPGWVEPEFCYELGINAANCGACLSNMAITPSGNVVPCQSWLSGPVLGNILKDSWEKIWNNTDCIERRNYSAEMNGECPLRKTRKTLDSITEQIINPQMAAEILPDETGRAEEVK